MMKKFFVLILVVLISLPAVSQIKFGIKAGAETLTVPTYDVSTGTSTITALEDASWGFHGGLFLRISLLGLYIQPEAVFATNTFDYNVSSGSAPVLKSQTFNRLSIPVLVGFKLGPVRLNAGPAAAIQIGSPEDLVDDPNFEDMYKGAIWGYQAGLGVDLFKRLTLDARYAGSLGEKFGDSVSIGSQSFKLDYGQSSFLLSLGIIF